MATMITDECINCGACEPECPNTAIYQGGVEYDGLDGAKHAALSNDFFYIVPEKCTECVGFFDHEACAAVCPVDCCVPDPNIPESEEVLMTRARQLHPEQAFPEDYPSRFKAGAAAPAASAAPAAAAAPAAPVAAAPAGGATFVQSPLDALADTVPALESWDVPLTCFRCRGEFEVPFQFIKPGTVLHCPHCAGSFVPNTILYRDVAKRVTKFYDSFTAGLDAIRSRHQAEIERFEDQLRQSLQKLKDDVKEASADAALAGAPQKNRGFFG